MPLNLEDTIRLDNGTAYVGFTGATGYAYQEHSVVAWRFNGSHGGDEDATRPPPNEHCRQRVPSLWQVDGWDGAPVLPANQALGCTTELIDPMTPPGAMHSVRCAEDSQTGLIVCRVRCTHMDLLACRSLVHVPACQSPLAHTWTCVHAEASCTYLPASHHS